MKNCNYDLWTLPEVAEYLGMPRARLYILWRKEKNTQLHPYGNLFQKVGSTVMIQGRDIMRLQYILFASTRIKFGAYMGEEFDVIKNDRNYVYYLSTNYKCIVGQLRAWGHDEDKLFTEYLKKVCEDYGVKLIGFGKLYEVKMYFKHILLPLNMVRIKLLSFIREKKGKYYWRRYHASR